MFADDTTIMIKSSNKLTFNHDINNSLNDITNSMNIIDLKCNINETRCMQIDSYNSNKLPIKVTYNHENVDEVDSIKFLGFTIDEHLNWKDHIEQICGRLSRFVFALRKLRISVSEEAEAYHGYMSTVIRYGLILWGNSVDVERDVVVQENVFGLYVMLAMTTPFPLFQKLRILPLPLFPQAAMWSKRPSVCSAVSGASKGEDDGLAGGLQLYPFAIALRVRVLQIVCGIGGIVVGAVGWLEERQQVELGLGVPAGAVTVLAAATSVYYSRGFGGWPSSRTGAPRAWGAPWRALGPTPCAAVPLTLLWVAAIAAHIAMLAFCIRSLLNIGCGSSTCIGVAGAQLSVSLSTLAAAIYMLQLDLRYDASLSPPSRHSDMHTCTAVSMVPLTSVAAHSGNSGDVEGSPHEKNKEASPPEPT